MKEIIPTNSDRAIKVDDEDYPLLSRFNWYISDTGYAMTQIRGQKHIRMHHLVWGAIAEPKLVIDHLNKDKLDNRKSNLRLCTQKENSSNRGGVKGYCWDENKKKWMVRYKNKFWGRYETEEEAKKAYQLAESGQEYQMARRKYYMLPKHISKQCGKYVVFVQKDNMRLRKAGIATLEEALSWRDKYYKDLAKED